MKCPLEGEISPENCAACYASLRHVPCPADIHNPTFVRICLGTTIEAILEDHPDWKEALE